MSDRAGKTKVSAERTRECVYGDGKLTKTDSFLSVSDMMDGGDGFLFIYMLHSSRPAKHNFWADGCPPLHSRISITNFLHVPG